mgnify:CR=1 FL=1
MKIIFRNKTMSFAEADRIIERYYEGESTVAEEKLLQKFLSSEKLPAKYDAERAIFGYFKPEKAVVSQRFILPGYTKWAAAVALTFTVGLSTLLYTEKNPECYAMIDGTMITDNSTIRELINSSIADISDNNEVEESLNNINNTNLINEQLEVFSGIE